MHSTTFKSCLLGAKKKDKYLEMFMFTAGKRSKNPEITIMDWTQISQNIPIFDVLKKVSFWRRPLAWNISPQVKGECSEQTCSDCSDPLL